jgi:hypothetical protein
VPSTPSPRTTRDTSSAVGTFLRSLDSEGLVKRGDTCYSLDYDESEYQITVDIDAAFGSIRVEWVD